MMSTGFMVKHVVAMSALAFIMSALPSGYAQPLVPAIITFGDSTVDAGNNDYLPTLSKADFLPYRRDFKNHQATGRFCNGKLATDITAETLGFTSFPPAYLSSQASGKNLLIESHPIVPAIEVLQRVPIQVKICCWEQQGVLHPFHWRCMSLAQGATIFCRTTTSTRTSTRSTPPIMIGL